MSTSSQTRRRLDRHTAARFDAPCESCCSQSRRDRGSPSDRRKPLHDRINARAVAGKFPCRNALMFATVMRKLRPYAGLRTTLWYYNITLPSKAAVCDIVSYVCTVRVRDSSTLVQHFVLGKEWIWIFHSALINLHLQRRKGGFFFTIFHPSYLFKTNFSFLKWQKLLFFFNTGPIV